MPWVSGWRPGYSGEAGRRIGGKASSNDATVGHTPAPRHHVVLGAYTFIRGWFISVTLWVAGLCIIVVVQELSSPSLVDGGTQWLGLAIMVLMYAFGIALVFAAPLAWVLGYLLRPVRNQRIHVGVFFAAPTLVFWTLGELLGLGWTIEGLGFWATVGAASAIGRWAVRRHVDLVPVPNRN